MGSFAFSFVSLNVFNWRARSPSAQWVKLERSFASNVVKSSESSRSLKRSQRLRIPYLATILAWSGTLQTQLTRTLIRQSPYLSGAGNLGINIFSASLPSVHDPPSPYGQRTNPQKMSSKMKVTLTEMATPSCFSFCAFCGMIFPTFGLCHPSSFSSCPSCSSSCHRMMMSLAS